MKGTDRTLFNDIWNKSYMNCGNEMKMKKWSSQWTQFTQLRKELSFISGWYPWGWNNRRAIYSFACTLVDRLTYQWTVDVSFNSHLLNTLFTVLYFLLILFFAVRSSRSSTGIPLARLGTAGRNRISNRSILTIDLRKKRGLWKAHHSHNHLTR